MSEVISIKSFPRQDNKLSLGDWYGPMLAYWQEEDPADDGAKEGLDFNISRADLWCIAVALNYLLVGYATLEGNLLSLANVREGFRRMGIYKQLVQARIDYAINELGVDEIVVEPVEETVEYFRRLGFVIDRVKPDYFGRLQLRKSFDE